MKLIVRILLVLLALALVVLLVPSPVPLAIAEEVRYPVYTPVTLDAGDLLPIPWDNEAHFAPRAGGYSSDNTCYDDPSIHVVTDSFRAFNSTVMVTWVQIADPSQIRTKLSGDSARGSKMAHVSGRHGFAAQMKAVVALSGDNCKDDQNSGKTKGGYIVRNHKVLREDASARDRLIVDENGTFHIIPGDGNGENGRLMRTDALERIREEFGDTVAHAFNFGPGLVVDGVKGDAEHFNRFGHSGPEKRAQRIAICQLDPSVYPLTYMIVATSGPENPNSTGLTLVEFADVVAGLGAYQAYNLDGGSSSAIVMNNVKINKMKLNNDRAISDAICFITLAGK